MDINTLISLVLPVYNEEKSLDELYNRSRLVLENLGEYEIIFVNDNSSDGSFRKLCEYAGANPRVRIIDFSRNFGHQIAITAGIDYAIGDAVVVMDSDLQDAPETIANLVAKWREGYDVVYAKRRQRKDTFFKKFTAFAFYRLLNKFASIDIPEDTGDFRLMDRKVADEMRKLRENARFMRGLTSWVGFRQTAVLFDRHERKHGSSNYPLKKMLRLAFDGLTSFSYIPLKFATLLGIVTAFMSFGGIGYALLSKLICPDKIISGWTFTIITIFFIGGVQLMVLGIIGEYIGRIYTETQNRPLYVIREKVNIDGI